MIRQKDKDQRALKARGIRKKYSLFNEVGAWTAAINALGKAGSLDSAMRLFHSMPKSGVQPNTITCGCLADCLLRHGRTSDTLSVLRYMKREGIAPSEVMYTSLITSAGRMVELENRQRWNAGQIMEDDLLGGSGDTKAIEVYTALMKTLTEDSAATDKESTQLMKVFLVFQEMKAAGAEPDLACYNSLLRVCSRAGDVTRTMDIMRKIEKDGLVPNDTSWRAALKSAATARRPDLAEDIWEKGLEIRGERQMRVTWKPSVDSFANLLSAYIREASNCKDNPEKQATLYKKVITMYKDIMTGSSKRKIEKQELMESGRALGMILRAFVSLDFIQGNGKQKMVLRRIAVSIAKLDLWEKQDRIENITWKSLQIAERWNKEYDTKDVMT
jgi:pentatricopeptide repeat protein